MFLSIPVQDVAVDIACRLRAQGSGRPLVFIHGVGCSKEDFSEAYSRAELQDHPLLSFDFPGCGDSPPYPETTQLGIGDLASITQQVTTAMRLHRPVIIGHSMGGAVALRCLEQQPTLAAACIAIEGNLTGSESTFTRTVNAQGKDAFVKEGFAALRHTFARSQNTGERHYAQTLQQAAPRIFYDYSRSLIRHSASGDLLDIFLQLAMPRAYLYGSHHESDFAGYAETFASRGIALTRIPGSAHWPMHDNPDAFYRAVEAFMQHRL